MRNLTDLPVGKVNRKMREKDKFNMSVWQMRTGSQIKEDPFVLTRMNQNGMPYSGAHDRQTLIYTSADINLPQMIG